MRESFLNGRVALHCGDNREVLRAIADCSIDSIVTDPPYALANNSGSRSPNPGQYTPIGKPKEPRGGFMGKAWDTGETAFAVEFWQEVFRALKPGGHVVAFGGTRTYHRMACAIEDAGFEVRDQLGWCFGSGFPKSHSVGKSLDNRTDEQIQAGVEQPLNSVKWNAWGTALKPAWEPIVLARKPLSEGTVASNVLKWGCGAINIDGTRIHADGKGDSGGGSRESGAGCSIHGVRGLQDADAALEIASSSPQMADDPQRRMPFRTDEGIEQSELAGGILDGQEIRLPAGCNGPVERGGQVTLTDAASTGILGASFGGGETVRSSTAHRGTRSPRQRGEGRQQPRKLNPDGLVGAFEGTPANGEAGISALSREPEAPRCTCRVGGRWPANIIHDGSDEVIAAFPETKGGGSVEKGGTSPNPMSWGEERTDSFTAYGGDAGSAARFFYTSKADSEDRLGSKHPTVKPVDLMQWLVRLVTPKNGLVLDPFAGTGTTAEACFREGMRCMLVERETEYQADIRRRMALVMAGPDERSRESIKAKTKDRPLDHGPLFAGAAE